MSDNPIIEEAKADTLVEDMRATIDRLQRQLHKEKSRTGDLVAAVREAVSDGIKALDIPPVTPPAKDRRRKGEETAVMVWSDWQLGKLTPSYSSEICEQRVEDYCRRADTIVDVQRGDHPIKNAAIFLVGDMIEGELIFPGQSWHIDSSLYRQITVDGPRILGNAVRWAASRFEHVDVYAVPGNHGYLGGRARKDMHPESNGDRMLYQITSPLTADLENVEWHISDDWWQVADLGDKCRFMLLHGDQVRGYNGIPWYGWCVAPEVEALTRDGWKTHDRLVAGEDVLVYDHEQGSSRWEPLVDVHRFPFSGELWTLDRPGHSIAFTEDHKWPTVGWKGRRELTRANEITTTHRIPIHGALEPDGESVLSPRLAALLGWVVTDGSARWIGNHWEAGIYQSPKKYLDEIVQLAGMEPGASNSRDDTVRVSLSLADRKAITKVYSDKDDLPALVGRLSREAAEAMFDAMMKAEGTFGSGRTWDRFRQTPGPVSDAFHMLSVLVGRTAWRTDPDGTYAFTSRRAATVRPTWGDGFGRRPHEGMVWCPETPSGTWWARSGGMVLPTGNTRKVLAWTSMSRIWPDMAFDHVAAGHFHTPVSIYLNGRRIWINASTESHNPYALEQLAAAGEPAQWLLFTKPGQGVTAEYLVQLTN